MRKSGPALWTSAATLWSLKLAESNCLDKQDPPGVKSGHCRPVTTGQRSLLREEGVGSVGEWGVNTGWSSAVGLSRGPEASWAGRAGPWFTGALNSPWESAVMDSLVVLHTGSLYQRHPWTVFLFFFSPLFHTQCPTRKNTNFPIKQMAFSLSEFS